MALNTDSRSYRPRRPSYVIGVVVGVLVGSLLATVAVAARKVDNSRASVSTAAPTTRAPLTSDVTGGSVAIGSPGASTVGPDNVQRPTSSGPPAASRVATAPAGCSGIPSTGVRGVTDTTIKIGFGIADISLLENLGPQYKLGDQVAYVRNHLDAMRKRGLLPVCGRDIVPVFRKYLILDPTAARAVCQGFINDDQVFAVVTQFAFGDANCVTQENKTFLLDLGYGLLQQNYNVGGGRLFGLEPVENASLRIAANMALRKKILDGKRVGVYYNNRDADNDQMVKESLIAPLQAAGADPVVVTSNTDASVAAQADPNDAVAVQRFKVDGVNVIFLLNSPSNFTKQAKQQDLKATYIAYGPGATDVTAASNDPEAYDGAYGVTWEYLNLVNSGEAPPPTSIECIRHLTDAGHARPHPEWGEWNASNLSCDLAKVIVAALSAAGRNLTTESLVHGMETIRDLPTAFVTNQTFTPNKHWGVTRNRVFRFHGDCKCWKTAGFPWEELFL